MNFEKFSLRSRLRSFLYAFNGLALLFKTEHNSRIHAIAAVVAIAMGAALKISLPEWSVIVAVIGLVFISELLNSALESLADTVNPELNEGIRKAKDYAAAAVLIAAIVSLVAGGIIFVPKILIRLSP